MKFVPDDGTGENRVILSAFHKEGAEEKRRLLTADPHIPAGARLY